MKPAERQALKQWEAFRNAIRSSTPIDTNETYEAKQKRIAYLEAHPQEWKQYYFPKYFKYPSPDFHLKASRRLLAKFEQNKHWYEVRHWARGLSKTTVTMFDFLFLALTGKLKNIALTSSTWDAAAEHLTKYQAQLDSNQRIIEDYGMQERHGSWSAGYFTTQKGVKFLAVGAGQSPRGSGNEDVRIDGLIVDDFDTDEECLNLDIINKKWDWYEKALLPTVDIANPYLIVWNGNIISEDCCVVRAGLMADHTETINIRNQAGESVWKEKNSEADIDYILSKMSYESGQQEFFNNPMRPGKAFKEMTYGQCPPLNEIPFAVIYGDPGTSNKDKPSAKSRMMNSCKAVGVIGFKGTHRYLYKVFVDHVNNSTFIDWIFAAKAYCHGAKATYIFVENNTLQDPFYEQVLKPLVIAKNKAHGTAVVISPDTRKKGDKYTRIEATLEPLNRNGQLILNAAEKDNPHMKRCEAQFKSAAPNSKTMDAPDMVEGGVFIINNKAAALNGKLDVRGKQRTSKY